jgi:hypothetical protein
MLTNLQSARELKIARKTALETELKNLSAAWHAYRSALGFLWKNKCDNLAEHDYNALDEVLLRVLARGRARSKRGGDVDGVFWYTKHVQYTLVWIRLWN